MSITVKQAIEAAVSYVQDFGPLFPNQAGLRLEETEYHLADHEWSITLSFLENSITQQRSAKLFLVDAETGEVKSMKNRIGR